MIFSLRMFNTHTGDVIDTYGPTSKGFAAIPGASINFAEIRSISLLDEPEHVVIAEESCIRVFDLTVSVEMHDYNIGKNTLHISEVCTGPRVFSWPS